MARGGRAGGRGRKAFRGGKGKTNRGGGRDTRTEPWSDITRKNDLFESYYRKGGFMVEDQFEEMWKKLATDLPNSFRFTGTKSDALAVREIFKQRYIPAIRAVKFEGKPVEPPQPVQGFPDELVWDMKTHKKVIRRHEPFADFQRFLVAETTSGNISRQEVVSMIPPHFLDVKPGMVVLDMCAAPGSKSAQLAEMIHGDEEERVRRAASGESLKIDDEGDYSDDGRSTGLLIANDTDHKRAGMLVHQVKRLNFPNLIVTQHDASIFPSIELPTAEGEQKKYLKFDRVLCDVPCSGDGTARKNPNVWSKWTPKDGLGLHNLQLRILFRGLQLLKKGGRLVYSTCSMNPVENEAVVAAAIEACGGISKVNLVDSSDHLPNLKRWPGMNKWKVLDTSAVPGGEKTGHLFTSWEAFELIKKKYEENEPERQFSTKIAPSVFPPIPKSLDERIPLERCMRVYPHLQDTGGFFIAVLEKLDDIKVTQIRNASNEAEARKVKAESESAILEAVPSSADQIDSEINGDSKADVPTERLSSPKRKSGDLEPEEESASKRVKTGQDNTVAEPPVNGTTEVHIPMPQPGDSVIVEDTIPGKGAPTEVEDSKPATSGLTATVAPSQKPAKLKPENQNQSKEYFEYLPADDPTIAEVLDFFGISERFPRDRFMVKNKEGLLLNKLYYTSALAKSILQANKARGMKFIHCGVVMFVAHKFKGKDGVKSPWRLQGEGIRILEPWASKRIVTLTKRETLHAMLIEMFPKLPRDGAHDLGEIGDQLKDLEPGCCFVRIEKSEGEDGFPFRMVLPLWRHPGSANLMVDKDDRKAMLLRLFNEKNPEIINYVVEKQKEDEAKKKAEEVDLDEVEKELDNAEAEDEVEPEAGAEAEAEEQSLIDAGGDAMEVDA